MTTTSLLAAAASSAGASFLVQTIPLFLVFVIANLMMLPLGWAIIKVASKVLTVPRKVLMPIILLFAIVGSYAINNSLFDVGPILAFGPLRFEVAYPLMKAKSDETEWFRISIGTRF